MWTELWITLSNIKVSSVSFTDLDITATKTSDTNVNVQRTQRSCSDTDVNVQRIFQHKGQP